MKKILLVEDNKTVQSILKKELTEDIDCSVTISESKKDTAALLEKDDEFFIALLDLNLPDAPHGEVVDLVIKHGIPVIILTGMTGKRIREEMVNKEIVDYVTKERPEDVQYLKKRILQLMSNSRRIILIAEDSKMYRTIMRNYLEIQKYSVIEAENGKEALDIINSNPNIDLVVTDYQMPEMDGKDFLVALRNRFSREKLPVIVLSSVSDKSVTADFLKMGANDFINKPFEKEEFDCRINNTISALENIEKVYDLANNDFLTGLSNRRSFFEKANAYYEKALKDNCSFVLAMIDVDDFKKVNDTYGHEIGDRVLKHFSSSIKQKFRGEDIIARIGGEEFCVILKQTSIDDAQKLFDFLRAQVAAEKVAISDSQEISYTISIGITSDVGGSLGEMICTADENLYAAKKGGKNRICLNSGE